MSQNDALLKEKGVPVLTKAEKAKLRGEWQAVTWDDMLTSLNSFGKYVMLRPTGFGKTYTCACACNIGKHTKSEKDKANKLGITLNDGEILLNNGNVISNKNIENIHKKKVIFVYISEILKQTFNNYVTSGLIENGEDRIVYETYDSVRLHWDDMEYLKEKLKGVGLIIFDEVQRMGAIETSKALDVAMPYIERLGIYYIGATATHERATGYDVCEKYFQYNWGTHIYSLNDCFKTGLLIPPHYQYITDNKEEVAELRKKLNHTRNSMLKELNIMDANNSERKVLIENVQELSTAVIKNSSKIVHDTMIKLYNCGDSYITPGDKLEKVTSANGTIQRPDNLPKYMRFLVFAPDRQSLICSSKVTDEDGEVEFMGNLVSRTVKDFKDAFARYGYRIRTTIISSANSTEKNNVSLIDNAELARQEKEEGLLSTKIKAKLETEDNLGKAVVPKDYVIDLIFSINMLNVGYHVDHITGIVFKRWTGSNQIYLQQLGRCLSSVSDNIPVVFDFVNVADSRGIAAPLYTYDRQSKKVTENADGTTNIEVKSKSKNKKKNKDNNSFNISKVKLDNEGKILPMGLDGNLVNPSDINYIDAKYILIDTAEASVERIISRCNVYQERTVSKKLYEKAYDLYASHIKIENGKVVSDLHATRTLESALREAIIQIDKKVVDPGNLSMNLKAFVEYIKNNEKDLYVLYDALDDYIKNSGTCSNDFKLLQTEMNLMLSATKVSATTAGARLRVIIDKAKIPEFKANTPMLQLLKARGFSTDKNNRDLLYY